jgi:2-amino-4-hydroxy-6-hydroxymethyldihydropteridine diphosphokinase
VDRVIPVAIALGSNLGPSGNRAAHLDFAVAELKHTLNEVVVSRWHDTEPAESAAKTDQPRFLNGALVGETRMPARALLDKLREIEQAAGRERPFKGAPRTLDLDLILYGTDVVYEPGLMVPHPRFRDRRFVLDPLVEIAPFMVDPVTGRTVDALLTDLIMRSIPEGERPTF